MPEIGDANPHGQKLVEKTGQRGNHPFALVWILECSRCGESYGANSCDFHIRKCPNCDDGAPGIELERAHA